MPVKFPEFKPIELADRDFIQSQLWKYQPETSELTFTNLFIWRDYYGVMWSSYLDWLLIVYDKAGEDVYALPPIGPPPRRKVARLLLHCLKEKGASEPRLERADQRLVAELAGENEFVAVPTRDHYDYVYRTQDLIQLIGRKYHAKRNAINTFGKSCAFTYEALTESHLPACLELADRWCRVHRCDEDMNLMGEWAAVRQALTHFTALKVKGGVIHASGCIEAFTIGELLNSRTAVVHIEKASPTHRGLYAVINQQFCEHNWQEIALVNREQDLGQPALRQAKLSYFPDHLVKKFRIRLKEE